MKTVPEILRCLVVARRDSAVAIHGDRDPRYERDSGGVGEAAVLPNGSGAAAAH